MKKLALLCAVILVAATFMPFTPTKVSAAPNQINGKLYWDKNNNGQQNTNEPGLPGIVVSFGYGTGQRTAVTDSNGNYTITGVGGSGRVTAHTGWLRSACNSLHCSTGTAGGNDFEVTNQIVSRSGVNGTAGTTLNAGLVPAWNGTYPIPSSYTPATTDIAARLTYHSGCTTTSVRTCATGDTVKLYTWFFNQGTSALTNLEFVVELPKGHTLNDNSWTDPKDVYNASHPQSGTVTILEPFDTNKGYGRYRLTGTIPAGASSSMAFTAAVTSAAVPTQTPYPTGEPFDKQAMLRVTHIDQSGDADSPFCETDGADWRTGSCDISRLGVHDKTKTIDHTDGAGWNISGSNPTAREHDLALDVMLAPNQSSTVAAGDLVHYTMRVSNQGQGDAGVRNVKITNNIPSGMTFSASDNPGWTLQSGKPTTFISAHVLPGQSVDVPIALRASSTLTETDNGTAALRNQAQIASFVRVNTTSSGTFMTASDINSANDSDFMDVAIGSMTPPAEPDDPPTDPQDPPAPQPTLWEYVINQGVESNLTGWSNTWGSSTQLSRTSAQAHEGTYSLRVDSTHATGTQAGFTNYQNRWVTATEANKDYTASAWVKGSTSGMRFCIRITEYSGNTNVGFTETCTTQNNTNWHQISHTTTAGDSGRSMTISIYTMSLRSGQHFLADNFSMTSLAP